jgi:hypothetical protein
MDELYFEESLAETRPSLQTVQRILDYSKQFVVFRNNKGFIFEFHLN